jgi:hypothetical protein
LVVLLRPLPLATCNMQRQGTKLKIAKSTD